MRERGNSFLGVDGCIVFHVIVDVDVDIDIVAVAVIVITII